MSEQVHEVINLPLSVLLSDPRNPNLMDPERFDKARAHIKKTGQYPLPVVRVLPRVSRYFNKKGAPTQYMLLDGHHRVKMLASLEYETTDVVLWPEMSDSDAGLYVAALNRNVGEDDPMRRAALIHDVQQTISLSDIALVLPENLADLTALLDMRQVSLELDLSAEGEVAVPEADVIADVDNETAIPVRFALFPGQHKVVMMALLHIQGDMEGRNKPARALEEMSADFLSGLSGEERIKAEIMYLASMDLNGELAGDPDEDGAELDLSGDGEE